MIEIGILEYRYHIKFLYTMMKICKTEKTNVTIFTTEEIYNRIKAYLTDPNRYTIILKKDKETINSFLKKVEKICNEKKIDILFINTIEFSLLDITHYFTFKPKSKMILTIHVANRWLKAKFSINIRNIFRSVDANLSIIFRSIILKKFDAVNVIYSPIKNYIQENTNYKKPVYTFPFNFFDESKEIDISSINDKIKFVIPGAIEEFRRDYKTALNVFEKLFDKFGNKISLQLLGKPIGKYGEEIIKQCIKMKEKKYEIIFSKDFIPEEEYDEFLKKCDIIFSPITVKSRDSTGIEEIYGTTEGSALPFEAIQYAKPFIVPKDFKVVYELKSSALTYDNANDLEKKLSEIIKDKVKLDKLKKNALKNSKKFSISILQDYFENNLLNIVQNI